jgi:hypothetical protein
MIFINNVVVIYDVDRKIPVGVICSDFKNGEIAYSTKDEQLTECLEILLDNKMFLLRSEIIKGKEMIIEEDVDYYDSFYLVSLNYSLPFPWFVLDSFVKNGKAKDLAEKAYYEICENGGTNND